MNNSLVPHAALRASVQAILEQPAGFDWTVQGFGFLRTYFGGKRWRLNVWDSALATNASTIHDHPWQFQSWIISGHFDNQRYAEIFDAAPTHRWMLLHTGVGGGPTPQGGLACLRARPLEHYAPGDTYFQAADEVHESFYGDGTVTLNERIGDTEHARVFWPTAEEWRDAMPRVATLTEIARTTEKALIILREGLL